MARELWPDPDDNLDWQDEQDAIGDILDDRDGDHDGFGSHWNDRISAIEGYCDYCEREGHTFRSCPRRDDHQDQL